MYVSFFFFVKGAVIFFFFATVAFLFFCLLLLVCSFILFLGYFHTFYVCSGGVMGFSCFCLICCFCFSFIFLYNVFYYCVTYSPQRQILLLGKTTLFLFFFTFVIIYLSREKDRHFAELFQYVNIEKFKFFKRKKFWKIK